MYQTIGEEVGVIGIYKAATFTPKKFQWHGRMYAILKVTLSNNVKDGGVRMRYYSIVAEGNLYRLSFNRETEIWTLEEVWYEG